MQLVVLESLKCLKPAPGGADQTYAVIYDYDARTGKETQVGRWPPTGYHELDGGQEGGIGVIYGCDARMKVKLWEWDSGADDFLGETILEVKGTERSGTRRIDSRREGTKYELKYRALSNDERYVELIEAKCVTAATGVDVAAFKGITDLIADAAKAAARVLESSRPDISAAIDAAGAVVRGVPEVAAAIDAARSDPDQLYLSMSNTQGVHKRIWPLDREVSEVHSGNFVSLSDVRVPLNQKRTVSINLWEYDSGSGDDPLGTLAFAWSDGLGKNVQVVASAVEGSMYIVAYEIHKVTGAAPAAGLI